MRGRLRQASASDVGRDLGPNLHGTDGHGMLIKCRSGCCFILFLNIRLGFVSFLLDGLCGHEGRGACAGPFQIEHRGDLILRVLLILFLAGSFHCREDLP